MSEIANTSYEEPINTNSLNNQDEGLNQEESSKSIDEYINDQKKILLDITDKNLQEQAQEEFQEVQEKFEALRWNTLDTTWLLLADLHQEFERDIKGMERLDDNKLSELLSKEEVKQLSLYVHSQWEQTEENFYSILSNMSDEVFQSIIIEFQDDKYFDDDDSLLKPKLMEKFVNNILAEHVNKIEQQEINELMNLDISSIQSNTQVDYYKQQILNISKYAQPDEEKQLNIVMEELNVLVISEVKNEEVEVKNEEVEVKNEEVEVKSKEKKELINQKEKLKNLVNIYWEIPKNISDKYSNISEKIFDINQLIDSDELINNQEKLKILLHEVDEVLTEVNNETGKTYAEELLNELRETDSILYNKVLKSFKEFSPLVETSLQGIKYISEENTEKINNNISWITQLKWALWDNYEISWNKAINGNKYMDLSVEPPQKYIRLENGFRLNSTVKFPKIITEKEQEFKQESEILTQEISEGKTDYNNKEFRKNELLWVKIKLDSSETSTDEKNKLAVEYPNLEYELSQLTLELNQLDSDIQEQESKLDEITQIFNREHKQAIDWYRAQAEAKDKKTEEVLKFLEGVGFNLIPQSITNSIIEQLNNPWNSGLRWLVWFNTILNLSEWDLGFQTSFNDDTLGTTEKVIFAEFLNRMISADAGKPIDVNKILNWWSVAVGDRTQLSIQLEQAGLKDSWTWIWVAMDNLRKSTLEK